MSGASVVGVVLAVSAMGQLAEGIYCYVGSEARMWSNRNRPFKKKDCSACGMFERYSGPDQMPSFTEIYFDCAPKAMLDKDGLCKLDPKVHNFS